MTIPCSHPKMTSEPSIGVDGLVDFLCQVPGCDWAIRTVKSAQEPAWHRQEHRDAVPTCSINKAADGWLWTECACGLRRRHYSRAAANDWRRLHLADEHGLAVCA